MGEEAAEATMPPPNRCSSMSHGPHPELHAPSGHCMGEQGVESPKVNCTLVYPHRSPRPRLPIQNDKGWGGEVYSIITRGRGGEGGNAKWGGRRTQKGQMGHSQLRGGKEIGEGTFKSTLDEIEQSQQKAGGAGLQTAGGEERQGGREGLKWQLGEEE